jgi:hypothetical protein
MRTGVVRVYDFASLESIGERAVRESRPKQSLLPPCGFRTEDLLNASKMASFREFAYCLDEKFDPAAA